MTFHRGRSYGFPVLIAGYLAATVLVGCATSEDSGDTGGGGTTATGGTKGFGGTSGSAGTGDEGGVTGAAGVTGNGAAGEMGAGATSGTGGAEGGRPGTGGGGTGGVVGTGGTFGTGGAKGGSTGAGGTSVGGTIGSGGVLGRGGSTASGGTTGTAGITGTGGAKAGSTGTGGASGGGVTGTGGVLGTGGLKGDGGTTSTGGVLGTGGLKGAAGTAGTGAGKGGSTGSAGTTGSAGVSGTGGTSSACMQGSAWSGGKTYSSNTQGNVGNGYSYQLWRSGSSGSMVVAGVDAKFSATWNSSGDFLARVGLGWNSTQTYDQLGTIGADYAYTKTGTAGGYSYIGIYGWSENPLHEYYIVDDWFGSGPPTGGGSKVGSFSVDGGTYNVYTHTQTNQPAITGGNATFVQYFSVRQTARQCGHISISEHFKEWANLGLTLGKMEEARILVEVGGGSGNIDFTSATVTTD